jgi:hypothetical protein
VAPTAASSTSEQVIDASTSASSSGTSTTISRRMQTATPSALEDGDPHTSKPQLDVVTSKDSPRAAIVGFSAMVIVLMVAGCTSLSSARFRRRGQPSRKTPSEVLPIGVPDAVEATATSSDSAQMGGEVCDILASPQGENYLANLLAPQEAMSCPNCGKAMAWSDYRGGPYQRGWYCNYARRCCGWSGNSGMDRWFCSECQIDICASCQRGTPWASEQTPKQGLPTLGVSFPEPESDAGSEISDVGLAFGGADERAEMEALPPISSRSTKSTVITQRTSSSFWGSVQAHSPKRRPGVASACMASGLGPCVADIDTCCASRSRAGDRDIDRL